MTEITFENNSLFEELNKVDTVNKDVSSFFDVSTYDDVLKRKDEKDNSKNIFKNNIIENKTKSEIIKFLNKINQNNIDSTAFDIKNINFTSFEDYKELVLQCLNKIKNTNEQMRYYIGTLCCQLHILFGNSDKKKINFKDLLLNATRSEYLEFIKFDIEKNDDKRILFVISTLYDVKILDEFLISKIFDDFRNYIKFETDDTNYESVELAIKYLCYFLNSLGFNNDLILKINNNNDKLKHLEKLDELLILSKYINKFLKEEIILYGNNISQKIIITVETTVDEIMKIEDMYKKMINV